MNRLALIVTAVSLLACGPAPRGEFTCPEPELAAWSFEREPSANTCDNARIVRNIALAKFEIPAGEPPLARELPVFVTRFRELSDDHNAEVSLLEGIALSCDGRGLVHAWAHQWFAEVKGRTDPHDHVGWSWQQTASDKFERSIIVGIPCE